VERDSSANAWIIGSEWSRGQSFVKQHRVKALLMVDSGNFIENLITIAAELTMAVQK
jgi:hypothetical protein